MKLAELTVGFDALAQALEANGGELTEELAATLAELNLAEREKVDRIVFYLKALEGEADALKKLEDEIAAKRKAKQRSRESLLAYVRQYMDGRCDHILHGDVFRFQLVKSGKPPVEVLAPVEQLPREWTTVTVVPNKEAIRHYIETRELPPNHTWADANHLATLARLGEPTYSVRIF